MKPGTRRHRPPEPAAAPRPGPVTTTRVSPTVMRAALRLAGGDARRLTIIDATHVEVREGGR